MEDTQQGNKGPPIFGWYRGCWWLRCSYTRRMQHHCLRNGFNPLLHEAFPPCPIRVVDEFGYFYNYYTTKDCSMTFCVTLHEETFTIWMEYQIHYWEWGFFPLHLQMVLCLLLNLRMVLLMGWRSPLVPTCNHT